MPCLFFFWNKVGANDVAYTTVLHLLSIEWGWGNRLVQEVVQFREWRFAQSQKSGRNHRSYDCVYGSPIR